MVFLDGSRPDVAPGAHVHHQNPSWKITSDYPLEYLVTCTDSDVCGVLLPGALGTFVYPRDARFHLTEKPTTTAQDLAHEVAAQSSAFSNARGTRMQHLSVQHADKDDVASEEEEDSEDDGDVPEADEEEEGDATRTEVQVDCGESDDDQCDNKA